MAVPRLRSQYWKFQVPVVVGIIHVVKVLKISAKSIRWLLRYKIPQNRPFSGM